MATHSGRPSSSRVVGRASAALVTVLAVASPAVASPLEAANALRREGCGPHERSRPLRREARLDAAARRMSRGEPMSEALRQSDYRAEEAVSLHVAGGSVRDDAALARVLERRFCRDVANPALVQAGVLHTTSDVWMILAAPFEPPLASEMSRVGQRVLELVNAARETGARCGARRFEPAPPLRLSARLTDVALGHSRAMLATGRFDHTGARGDTPPERVAGSGYAAARVAENLAAGPTTAAQVVQGWIDSPGHCANLMDPRFVEMGLAYASDARSRDGIYWTQVFATPE